MSIETRITEAATAAVRRLDEDLRTRLAALTQELRAAGADAEAAAAASLATAAAEHADAVARHADAAAALEQKCARLQADLTDRELQLAELRARTHAARNSHSVALAQIREEADGALGEAERVLAEAIRQARSEDMQGKTAALVESTELARPDAAVRVEALAHAVSGMDEATTLSEVLDALSEGLVAQVPRSAVLVFQDDRARVWRRHGFPADAPGSGVDLRLSDHADLKAIVDSAAPAIVEASEDLGPVLGLAPLPDGQRGLAVPVAIGGQAAALVYADGGDDAQALAPGWTDAVEILARHAARCLETLTAMRAAGYARTQRPAIVVPMPPHLRVLQRPTLETSMGDAIEQARRVARLLVSEIRLNKEADVTAGRAQGDLGTRLADDIARARRQYMTRVAEALPGRDALFNEEIVRTLANGDAALLQTGS